MATAIVEAVIGELAGAVAGKLGEMAVEQVAKKASLLLHFRKDFEWLQKELTDVRGYLQYEHDQNEPVKKWFADMQDIALDAEDVVQECAVQPLYGGDSIFSRYIMGKRIRKLKERMHSIMKDLARLHLVQQVGQAPQSLPFCGRAEEWKKSGLLERDARPVAIDAKVEQILHLLEDDAHQVIAVVGMGGIGKTFLLQNVYNHHKVQQKFKKTIWLSISQVYSVARLQCDIASHLHIDVKASGVTEQRAAELIHNRLKDESCLIVLDDVWRVEGSNNLMQKLGIPSTCKVAVTTRSIEVCNIMGASHIYHMELLSDQDSWNLFCLHAFPTNQNYSPPQELDEVAHQVERECSRFPLAIKTIAASMASQKELISWKSKLRQLKEVSHLPDPIEPILRLSYDALPPMLKCCFLYFSFFGEDVVIDAEYLMYLWIGEGFVPEGKEQWNTGWSYLKQLNNLCLVEVSVDEELRSSCKIHDLLLDLTISISKENRCAFTVEEASAVGCRRILLAKKGLYSADISRLKCPKSLRTLSLSENSIRQLPTESLTGVGAMRVIDISNTGISLLLKRIVNFKLLKVLNLRNVKYLKVLPDCVRKLKSLRFLDANTCSLPEWIGDLKCLQHLHVRNVPYGRQISKLASLRTLRVGANERCELVLKDVAKLIHLEEVRIFIANADEMTSLNEGVLANLVSMRRLTIHGWPVNDMRRNFPHFPEKMKAMKDLMVLVLQFCDISQCPALATMPNLMKLDLYESISSRELPEWFGKSGAFPQLRSLRIVGCLELEKLPDLQNGAMPRVEVFKVFHCGRLEKLPEGFEHLTSLKLLDLRGTEATLEEGEKLRVGGEYWNKIKANNPDVTIYI